MSGYTPKRGDRVRSTIEGYVRSAANDGTWKVHEDRAGGRASGARFGYFVPSDMELVGPEWQWADVVVCADHSGGPFIRTHDGDWINSNGDRDSLTGCDLTLVVRAGRAVSA